jgi:hypothetical protein
MSKPGGGPSSGISLGDALRLPKRHPACRRREAQPGSGTERENLTTRTSPAPSTAKARDRGSTTSLRSPYTVILVCLSRNHRVHSCFKHNPILAIGFRQDLSKGRLQFLDRKLLPLFDHRSPLWGGQYRRSVIAAPVPPPLTGHPRAHETRCLVVTKPYNFDTAGAVGIRHCFGFPFAQVRTISSV